MNVHYHTVQYTGSTTPKIFRKQINNILVNKTEVGFTLHNPFIYYLNSVLFVATVAAAAAVVACVGRICLL